MKTLTVQQPWASLICSGIMDVVNMKRPTNYRGRILIHAGSKRVPYNFGDKEYREVSADIYNNMYYGNITSIFQMPTSAIIGFVDVVQCTREHTNSIYDSKDCEDRWILDNAYMFDEPIIGVKGKSYLFEYEMDENNLPPYHKVNLRTPEVIDGVLFIPIPSDDYENMVKSTNEGSGCFILEYDGTNYNWIELLKKKKLAFVAADTKPLFVQDFKVEIRPYLNYDFTIPLYKTLHGGMEPHIDIDIFFGRHTHSKHKTIENVK